jgi:hypothetical protein
MVKWEEYPHEKLPIEHICYSQAEHLNLVYFDQNLGQFLFCQDPGAKKCTKDASTVCKQFYKLNGTVCQPQVKLENSISNKYAKSTEFSISLEFEFPIEDKNFTELIKISFTGDESESTKIDLEIESYILENETELTLKLKIPEGLDQLPSGKFSIEPKDPNIPNFMIFHNEEIGYAFKEPISIPITGTYLTADGVESISAGIKGVSTATQVINLVILGLNLPMAIAVMKLFQNIDYLNMLSLDYIPLNLQRFLEFFN